DEAYRRGIRVDIIDSDGGFFDLSLGGRSISCRESLTDLTSAVAMSRCADKEVTNRFLSRAGLEVTGQTRLANADEALDFLQQHGRIVIKPAEGEQGEGVFVDLRREDEVRQAWAAAAAHCDKVLGEAFFEGQDLRIIVIDERVVAAAVRAPASIVGDGVHRIDELIDKQSRRRSAATQGESAIPVDAETRRCVRDAGYDMQQVLDSGIELQVRKTANLHTGGTLHDVTEALHPELADAAIRGALALDMPLVGFDFIVEDPASPGYVVIEANERPGLANHEPQPTAERFIDMLFPQTATIQDRPHETS
ncbi:MAG: N-acetylglutaminylglutamine synthetase, partial [Gammaproteobacteria bacterium]